MLSQRRLRKEPLAVDFALCEFIPMSKQVAVTFELLRGFGLSQGYAYDLANGARKPSLKMAVRLQQELGIPVTFWPAPRPAHLKQDRAA